MATKEVKEVCFSAKTSQIPYVKALAQILDRSSLGSFYQEDISLTG